MEKHEECTYKYKIQEVKQLQTDVFSICSRITLLCASVFVIICVDAGPSVLVPMVRAPE